MKTTDKQQVPTAPRNLAGDLFRELDKLAIWGSSFALLFLLICYFVIGHWMKPAQDSFWSLPYKLSLDVITDLVPIDLLFLISYLSFRRIQSIRTEQETDQLIGRFTSQVRDTLRAEVDEIRSYLHRFGSTSNPPLRTRNELPDLGEDARVAKDVLIIAQSGAMVLRQIEFFEDRLREGATVRLALANPECDAAVEAMIPLSEMSREGFIADMKVAQDLVQRIREQGIDSEGLHVRVYDWATTLSLVMVDGDLPTGHIVVEMVPYRVSPGSRPHLYVTGKDAPTWYAYFWDVCERIWRDAKPLQA